MDYIFPQKNPKKSQRYFCECCETGTDNKKDFDKHLLTAKHLRLHKRLTTNSKPIEPINDVISNKFHCICGNMYTHHSSLCKHKRNCSKCNDTYTPMDENVYNEQSDLIFQLLQENKEIKNILSDMASKPPTQTIINNNNNYGNNNNNNNNKQQFNLNFFLNETCKDAMNIDEFINTLVITDAELEDFGKLGYVQGISNILIRGLKELGEHHRPIHNTDKKRNVLYMKYKEGWEKEVDEPLVFKNYLPTEIPKMTVRRMIYRISKKGFFGMNTWKQNNPTHSDITTKKHEEYMVLLHQLMCGHEPPDLDISKIVKIVSEKTLFITKR